jgi:hypothetical protein
MLQWLWPMRLRPRPQGLANRSPLSAGQRLLWLSLMQLKLLNAAIGLHLCSSSPGPRDWQIAALSRLLNADVAFGCSLLLWPSLMQLRPWPPCLVSACSSSLEATHCSCVFADAALAQAQIAALCMLLNAALAFADAAQAQAPGSGGSQPSQRVATHCSCGLC